MGRLKNSKFFQCRLPLPFSKDDQKQEGMFKKAQLSHPPSPCTPRRPFPRARPQGFGRAERTNECGSTTKDRERRWRTFSTFLCVTRWEGSKARKDQTGSVIPMKDNVLHPHYGWDIGQARRTPWTCFSKFWRETSRLRCATRMSFKIFPRLDWCFTQWIFPPWNPRRLLRHPSNCLGACRKLNLASCNWSCFWTTRSWAAFNSETASVQVKSQTSARPYWGNKSSDQNRRATIRMTILLKGEKEPWWIRWIQQHSFTPYSWIRHATITQKRGPIKERLNNAKCLQWRFPFGGCWIIRNPFNTDWLCHIPGLTNSKSEQPWNPTGGRKEDQAHRVVR